MCRPAVKVENEKLRAESYSVADEKWSLSTDVMQIQASIEELGPAVGLADVSFIYKRDEHGNARYTD